MMSTSPHGAWLEQADQALAQGDIDQVLKLWGAYRLVNSRAAAGVLAAGAALRRGCDDERRLRIEYARMAVAVPRGFGLLTAGQSRGCSFLKKRTKKLFIVSVESVFQSGWLLSPFAGSVI